MSQSHWPPKLFFRFFRWFCHPKLRDYIEGDLLETYNAQLTTLGKKKADLKFIIDVLLLFRPGIIKPVEGYRNLNNYGMIKSYCTIALRTIVKNKTYSFINIAGLSIAVASCMVIILFITNELSFDRFNEKANRIYRVDSEVKFGENESNMAVIPAPAGSALMQDYPEVESFVRCKSFGAYLVKAEDGKENIRETNVFLADSTFFNIFSIKILEGNIKNALNQPSSIAISSHTARKYFHDKSALNKSLILDNKFIGKITVVFEDVPAESHFHLDILLPTLGDWPGVRDAQSGSFLNCNFNTYLLLRKGADPKVLEAKFPAFIKKYVGPQVTATLGNEITIDKFYSDGNKYRMTLTPLLDIHLHSDLVSEVEPNGNITYVYLLGTIALFILAIACINCMNLVTVQSIKRTKEIGIRRVMGSMRVNQVTQFLLESILITILSSGVAIGLAYLCMPAFNSLTMKQISVPFSTPLFYLVIVGSSLVIGVLVGAYPSFFLSSFKPVSVLKGHAMQGMGRGTTRSTLVVFQFFISILLIAGTITVNRQLAFIRNKNLGFEKNQMIIVKDAYSLYPNIQSFKNEALKINTIEGCTITGFLPVDGGSDISRSDNSYWKEGVQPTTENLVSIQNWFVDNDYIKTFQMKIKAGRGFSTEFPSDASAVVLNEAAVLQFGLGNDPIGKKISALIDNEDGRGSANSKKTKTWTVIGVVENFHFSSMHHSISPLGLFVRQSNGFLCFRFNRDNPQETIQQLENIWKQMAPGQPFQYSFLNEDFGKTYASEERLSKILFLFTWLAIIIACLGLFAFTAFIVEQRTKEIGIRKVLGATVAEITALLSKEFIILIFIAILIASPVSWYFMNRWLTEFVFRVDNTIWVYIVSGLAALFIGLITISFKTIAAAMTNPVNSLRSE